MRIFYTCSQTWVMFSTRNLHTVQLTYCKFRANWHREGSTILMGVHTIVHRDTIRYLENVEGLDKLWLLHDGARHFQSC